MDLPSSDALPSLEVILDHHAILAASRNSTNRFRDWASWKWAWDCCGSEKPTFKKWRWHLLSSRNLAWQAKVLSEAARKDGTRLASAAALSFQRWATYLACWQKSTPLYYRNITGVMSVAQVICTKLLSGMHFLELSVVKFTSGRLTKRIHSWFSWVWKHDHVGTFPKNLNKLKLSSLFHSKIFQTCARSPRVCNLRRPEDVSLQPCPIGWGCPDGCRLSSH